MLIRSILSCSLFLPGLCAQTPATASPKPDYSQEAFVIEQSSTELAFENDGTSAEKIAVRVRIQSDAGVQRFAVLTFPYQSSTQTMDIDYVRVRKADGSVVNTPAEGAQDIDSEITRQAPLYSDLREKHLAVKGLGAGDLLEYEVRGRTTKPLAPGQFWYDYSFSDDSIILQETLQVSTPRGRAVKWRSSKVKPTISETDSRHIFSWTYSVLEHKSKEQSESDRRIALYDSERGKLPQADVQISSFQTWDEVGRWYNVMQQDRAKPTPEIRAKAAELTKGLTDDRAKAAAIYNYVSTQVHYIGIDFGIGRYQPHAAGEVLNNQYGDCKDKHTLLAALLDAAGIHAWPALIGTSHDLDPEVPSPSQFDHVISAVALGDHLTWLDATQEISPFAYLVSPLRGKKALLVSSDAPPALVITPTDPPTKPLETFRIDAKLSDSGVLDGKMKWAIQGNDGEILLRMAFRRTPLPQWKTFIQQFSYALTFAGEISDVTASSPEKTDEPFQFEYKYVRKDYPGWSDRRIGSPIPPVSLPAAPDKDVQSTTPIWLGPPMEFRYESHVELPKGYRAAPPANLDISESFAEYHRSYAMKDGILTTERRIVVKLSAVPVAEIESYRKFFKAVGDDQERTVPLATSLSPVSYQSEIWDLPYSENPEAARAYDDARDKFTKQDLAGEIASLKHAVEVDPKFIRAWLWLGEIYKSSRRTDEAIETYRKAIGIDPRQAVSYKALAYTLVETGKLEESIPVWQELIKAAPADGDGPKGLGSNLLRLKRYAEAKPVLEAAVQMDPDSPFMHFHLGAVYLQVGDPDSAAVQYKKGVELDPQPFQFNFAAWELAEAGQLLPLALEFAERAVTEEGVKSKKVDLSQLKREDLEPTNALAAYWDTLGWVYFKMGNLDRSEKYLNAAWVLSQDAAVADHLGQVYERQNKKPAAIHMYKIAWDRAKVRPSPDFEPEKIRERLERLSPGGSKAAPGKDTAGELSQMRTIKLSLPAKEQASAEFFLLFSKDKVEAVKFISGSETLKSADAALKSASFKAPMPDDGDARLLRRGVLFCSPLSGCSMTLVNPSDVSSVN
jgi:tetratricopeptide (TPR) repeat protein